MNTMNFLVLQVQASCEIKLKLYTNLEVLNLRIKLTLAHDP